MPLSNETVADTEEGWPFQLLAALPPLGEYTIGADFARILVGIMIGQRPSSVLEAGSGVSTVLASYCLKHNGRGHIFALEHLPAYAEATRELLRNHGLQDYATVLDAPLKLHSLRAVPWIWYETADPKSQRYDLLIVDGPPRPTGPMARYPILPLYADRLTARATILLDDASRADEESILRRWQAEFPEYSVRRFDTQKGAAQMSRDLS